MPCRQQAEPDADAGQQAGLHGVTRRRRGGRRGRGLWGIGGMLGNLCRLWNLNRLANVREQAAAAQVGDEREAVLRRKARALAQ